MESNSNGQRCIDESNQKIPKFEFFVSIVSIAVDQERKLIIFDIGRIVYVSQTNFYLIVVVLVVYMLL